MFRIGRPTCRAVRRVLWDYTADRLSEGPMEMAERHLAECAACRREAEAVRRAQGLLWACRQESPPPPRSGWAELQDRLIGEGLTSPRGVTARSRPCALTSRWAPGGGRRLQRPGGEWLPKIGLASGFAACLLLAAWGYRAFLPAVSHSPVSPGEQAGSHPSLPGPNQHLALSASRAAQPRNAAPERERAPLPDVAAPSQDASYDSQGAPSLAAFHPEPRRRALPANPPASLTPKTHRDSAQVSNAPRQPHDGKLHFKPYQPSEKERLPSGQMADSTSYSAKQIVPVNSPHYFMDTLEPINHEDDPVY
jgi:hypothetical protein